MTYARARLWLGISGVGSLVTLATILLITGQPYRWLSSAPVFGWSECVQLIAVVMLFSAWLVPLDSLGGYLLPKTYRKSEQSFGAWCRQYIRGILSQSTIFVVSGAMLILLSQSFGLVGVIGGVCAGSLFCFMIRNWIMGKQEVANLEVEEKIFDATTMIQSWRVFVPKVIVRDHTDVGFTGGIIGWGKNAKIVIPKAWLDYPTEELAVAIARRAVAIDNGSYSRGLVISICWNVTGILLCGVIPGGGFSSVAALVTSICWFTIWSFIGLLFLPSASRHASLSIDRELLKRGMPTILIQSTAAMMDRMQDDEPDRPKWIERIFHPVPNVTSRNREIDGEGWAAWNVARNTLFFSWACLGLLSRSVHCNVGRPELWLMLPTD